MDSIFAAKQSGMAAMLESMIPTPVMEAIRQAQEQIPILVDTVKKGLDQMRVRQDEIDGKLTLILARLDSMQAAIDPSFVPELQPVHVLATTLPEIGKPGSLVHRQLEASNRKEA